MTAMEKRLCIKHGLERARAERERVRADGLRAAIISIRVTCVLSEFVPRSKIVAMCDEAMGKDGEG